MDAAALRSILDPGQEASDSKTDMVLWLDDLEPFLNQGVTLQLLEEWHSRGARRIVAATFGGKGSDLVAGSSTSGLATIATSVLQRARKFSLGSDVGAAELTQLRSRVSSSEMALIERHGLAAYLVAGPALETKLVSGRAGQTR